MPGNSIRADELRSLAFGSISATYAAIGSAMPKSMQLMIIQNFCDTSMIFSFTGSKDHLVLPSNGQVIFDFTTNQINRGGGSEGLFIDVGTTIYVKQVSAPSSGSVYVSAFYSV